MCNYFPKLLKTHFFILQIFRSHFCSFFCHIYISQKKLPKCYTLIYTYIYIYIYKGFPDSIKRLEGGGGVRGIRNFSGVISLLSGNLTRSDFVRSQNIYLVEGNEPLVGEQNLGGEKSTGRGGIFPGGL